MTVSLRHESKRRNPNEHEHEIQHDVEQENDLTPIRAAFGFPNEINVDEDEEDANDETERTGGLAERARRHVTVVNARTVEEILVPVLRTRRRDRSKDNNRTDLERAT